MNIIGIDPGLSGGIARFENGQLTKTWVMPVHGDTQNDLDVATLTSILQENKDVAHAFLEHVTSRPGQGVVSTFKFGRVFGIVEAALCSTGISYSLIPPKVWQTIIPPEFTQDDPKERAKQYAVSIFDIDALLATTRSKVPHSGIVDATLLGYWGLKRYANVNNLEELNNFYVYIYLDPRKPGIFTYGDLSFEYEPFYVGKGSGARITKNLKDKTKIPKANKIRSIVAANLHPITEKVYENLCELDAFIGETYLIALIGRRDRNQGPLTNLTDGGEGLKGFIADLKGENNPFYGKTHTQEVKEKLSAIHRGKTITDDHRKAMSIAQLGRKHTEDTKLKISQKQIGKKLPQHQIDMLRNKKLSDETKNKIARSHLGSKRSLESRAKQSDSMKGRKNTPDQIAKTAEAHKGRKRSPETRAKLILAARNRTRFKNPLTGRFMASNNNATLTYETWD